MTKASVRAKGKKLEVLAGKLLGNWWWGQPFPRSHGSGSSIVYCSDGTVIAGDLHVTKDFPFCVECKNQEGWSLDAVFAGTCKKFEKWWDQTQREATESSKIPMLIATRNSFPVYMIMKRWNGGEDWASVVAYYNRVVFEMNGVEFVLVELEDFVKYKTVSRVKEYVLRANVISVNAVTGG